MSLDHRARERRVTGSICVAMPCKSLIIGASTVQRLAKPSGAHRPPRSGMSLREMRIFNHSETIAKGVLNGGHLDALADVRNGVENHRAMIY